MYFLSKIYQGFKCGLGIVSSLISIALSVYGGVIVAGVVGGGTVVGWIFVAAGIVTFFPAVFSLFDASKILNDIKREFERFRKNLDTFEKENDLFKTENENLRGNVTALENAKNQFIEENKRLITSLGQIQDQLKQLNDLKLRYEKEVETLKNLMQESAIENGKLKEAVTNLQVLREELVARNKTLDTTVQNLTAQMTALEAVKVKYEEENEKFKIENGHLAEIKEGLELQILKLHGLYQNSRDLIKNLIAAGDVFKEFQNSIGTDVGKLNSDIAKLDGTNANLMETAQIMSSLAERLNMKFTSDQFQNLDQNNDGVITEDEFTQGVLK